MYIEKFSKNNCVYYGFFTELAEYPADEEIPVFLKTGELTQADLMEAEQQQTQG